MIYVAGSEKVLSKGKHLVPINDKDIEMIAESYPLSSATEDINSKSAVTMETEDDWISVPTNVSGNIFFIVSLTLSLYLYKLRITLFNLGRNRHGYNETEEHLLSDF